MKTAFKKRLFAILFYVSLIYTAVPLHSEVLLDDGDALTGEPLEAPEADELLSSSDTISYDEKTLIKEENDKDISLNEAFVKMQASSSGHWEEKVVGYEYACNCGARFSSKAEINQHQFEAAINQQQGHTGVAEIAITERVWVEDPEPTPEPEPSSTYPMYRLYNRSSGEHFYTSNLTEKTGLVAKGWKDEGTGWYAPVSGGSPVIYRLYNPKKGFEEHHYTADQNEIRVLKAQNWNLEGPAWASASSDGVPVYRLFNKAARNSASSHHYTTDVNEKNVLSAGTWRYEGIAWYGKNG